MGAQAFATGNHVAFAGTPDLHTAAHEAAHVVQQRGGVQLKGGVGEVGDAYERHADQVADRVVAGENAQDLLDQHAPAGGASSSGSAGGGKGPVQDGAEAGGPVQLRKATWIERQAWLALFDHYLAKKLLNNYMNSDGKKITLTEQEMKDCQPEVTLYRSNEFLRQVRMQNARGGGTAKVDVSGEATAHAKGTLNAFTIRWRGSVTVRAGGIWTFTGTIEFRDTWNFDPKPFGPDNHRSIAGEIKARIANGILPGKGFPIDSVRVPATQSSKDDNPKATWGSGVAASPHARKQ